MRAHAVTKPPRPRWRAALLLSLPALLMACRKEPPCHGEVTKDDLFRQMERVQAGVEVCPEHLAPKIEANAAGVVLDGRKLSGHGSLPSGSIRKIEPLFAELKLYRERWKQLHPSKVFDAHPRVLIGGDVDAVGGISVLQSTAFAGYPRMRIESAGAELEIYWSVPMPPQPDGEGPARETLRVVRGSDDWFTVSMPDSKPRPSDAYARDVPGMLASVEEACSAKAGACAQTLEIETGAGAFAELVQLARTLMNSKAFSRRLPALKLGSSGR